MTSETLHEAKAHVEDHIQRVRDRLRQGYRMELETPDGFAHEFIGSPETLQAIADRLEARALAPALDRVIEEVEKHVPRNHLDHAETVQCLAVLRALRAADTAPETQDE